MPEKINNRWVFTDEELENNRIACLMVSKTVYVAFHVRLL
ncbi:hypothetical protein BH10ACI3_BH10ACI3_10050 [soil metagenome]